MPDPFTILPGTVDPVASKPTIADAPAVAVPPVTVKNVDATIAEIKARLAGKPNDNPNPDDKDTDPDSKTVPPKVLAELGRLQKLVRELEPKAKEADTIKTEAELAREVKKLWSGTHEEKLQALAKLSGRDGLDELVAVIKAHYDLEQSKPDSETPESPEIKKLSEQLATALKKIEALETGNAEKEKNAKATVTKEEQDKANAHVKGFIEKNKAKFEICAREENAEEAIDLIQSAVIAIIDRDKIDLKTMTQEQAEAAYQEAAAKTEAAFEATAKRLSKNAAPADPLTRFDRFVKKTTPPTIVVKDEAPLSPDPAIREQQVRARLIAKYEAGGFSRT